MSIYLDWNSQGFIHPQVMKRMLSVEKNYCNPSSKHSLGQKSKRLFSELAHELLSALDALEYDVIFTSSATEANYAVAAPSNVVYVSDLEHPSLRDLPWVKIIPVNSDGILNMKHYSDNQIPLISYMLANHETGIINDIAAVKNENNLLHSDMTQAFGRIDISLRELKVDYATISSHKAGGPCGIGALLYKKFLPPPKITRGTVPLWLIAGLVETLKIPKASNAILERMLNPNSIVGHHLRRLPNTTCVKCNNKSTLMMQLDFKNILCSSGAACATEASDRAHSPEAMGIIEDTMRISSGWKTTKKDLLYAGKTLVQSEPSLAKSLHGIFKQRTDYPKN